MNLDQDTLQALVQALAFPAFIVNEAGTVLAVNELTSKVLGNAQSGQHLHMVMRSPDILQAFEKTVLTKKPSNARHEARGIFALSLEVHFAPLGENYLVTCHDVTREENVERMRSDFVANASHELRTPLTTLSGFIDTMQGAARQDEKARDTFLGMMRAQADRMSRLIDDLLSLSRIELDEHVAPQHLVDLCDIARQTENLLRSMAKETNSTIELQLPGSLLVYGDASQLSQVVHNLVENALKYAGEHKRVVLRAQQEGGMAILQVSDNGPGIAPHHVPRLTERFYRVNVQASRNRGGTGLGLAICKHILNRHRGKLTIESVLGQGSVFSIHVPAQIKPAKTNV